MLAFGVVFMFEMPQPGFGTFSSESKGRDALPSSPKAAAVLVYVGVCTAGRPQLLAKCLASLVLQRAPRGYEFRFLVVDNDYEPKAHHMVDAASVHSRHAIDYVHEVRRGISFARNRVLEEALAAGADWIGFIDDDETAPPNWLIRMLAAARRYQADVLQGPVIPVLPEPLPFWYVKPRITPQRRAMFCSAHR
jgi:succinoglycan biosynthesis protein ExoM